MARRGAAVLLAVVLLLGAAGLRVSGALGGDPQVAALVTDAGGALRPGSDVKVRGVVVGRVEEVLRDPGGDVRVQMRLREDDLDRIPGNVVARILPATVFGTTYVDLAPPGGGAPAADPLRPGDTVPADTGRETLELQQALDDIDRLVTALGPAELASAIGSVADALDGRGAQVGRILDTLDAYLARLEPLLPVLRSDLAVLADALDVVDRVAPDLLAAAEDGRTTLRTIADQQEQLSDLLTSGTGLAERAGDLLGENRDPLVRWLDASARTIRAVHDEREAAISGAIRTNLGLADIIRDAVREGFLQVDAVLRPDAPPYYTEADRPRYGGTP